LSVWTGTILIASSLTLVVASGCWLDLDGSTEKLVAGLVASANALGDVGEENVDDGVLACSGVDRAEVVLDREVCEEFLELFLTRVEMDVGDPDDASAGRLR
jgi:hypothetical protein